MEPALLLLLHYGPAHGYTLIEELGRFGLGSVHASAAYRALRDMESRGLVSSSWSAEGAQGPPRRVYRLTTQGNEVLGAHMRDLRQARSQMSDLMDAYDEHMRHGEGAHHRNGRQRADCIEERR
jgi:DNA-binding PadR family transcriptional regulator